MFTGIIVKVGRVAANEGNRLRVRAKLSHARRGASVAVNGVCLTVTRASKAGVLDFDVSDETLRLTNLGELKIGERVNLERALRAGDTLGGHMVSGHVDARAKVLALEPQAEGFALLRAELPASLAGLVALKGSVAVDGISLTVSAAASKHFEVALIPYTLRHTNLGARKPGDTVNLEADLIARYVASVLKARA